MSKPYDLEKDFVVINGAENFIAWILWMAEQEPTKTIEVGKLAYFIRETFDKGIYPAEAAYKCELPSLPDWE